MEFKGYLTNIRDISNLYERNLKENYGKFTDACVEMYSKYDENFFWN